MSKKKDGAIQPLCLTSSGRRRFIAALTLICCFVAAAVLVAHREPSGLASAPTLTPTTVLAPQGQQPVLSKEYIYAGARLIATEQPCSYVISPSCGAFGAGGTESSFNVITGAGCGWTASSNASWITISSQSSGTGNATISFVVRDNTTGAGRQGMISIAGLLYTVMQMSASNCTYTISPANAAFGPGGGAGTVNVTATIVCAWQAVSNNNWITLTSSVCGLGNGVVSYSTGVNTTGSTRTGAITVNGKVFSIKQTGA